MGITKSGSKGFSVTAYPGDAKTLLAFNFAQKKSTANLAGFTIECHPEGQDPYYLLNSLRSETQTAICVANAGSGFGGLVSLDGRQVGRP